ncbi:MAG: META domain-containing protein [Synechococcaceae cyanobacterium]
MALTTLTGGPGWTQENRSVLADSAWRLVEIRSMDDAQGARRPADSSRYTLRLQRDGRAVLQLDCNRATGSWTAEPSSDPANGGFRFGPLATTRALCPPPSLGDTLGAQLPAVRGYMLRGGLLSLSLMADAGVLLFEPLPSAEVRYSNSADPALERAIRQSVPDYRRSVVGANEQRWARYVHAATDLDGDGREEVLVYLMGSFFCGTGGCNLQVYRTTPQGYTLVNDLPISRLPVVAAETRSKGWRDLWKLESGGGAPASYVRYGFDGDRYRERERIPAQRGLPKGLAVLSGNPTFAEGVPLRPRD